MPKATFTLPDGTTVMIDGSAREVKSLLEYYSARKSQDHIPVKQKTKIINDAKNKTHDKKTTHNPSADLIGIVKLIKTCDEAGAIEKEILDQSSEVNRVLLPLYMIYKHKDNSFGLTTTELSKVTEQLHVRVSRQNSLRALKDAPKYIASDRARTPRYKLNRRGAKFMEKVLSGTAEG